MSITAQDFFVLWVSRHQLFWQTFIRKLHFPLSAEYRVLSIKEHGWMKLHNLYHYLDQIIRLIRITHFWSNVVSEIGRKQKRKRDHGGEGKAGGKLQTWLYSLPPLLSAVLCQPSSSLLQVWPVWVLWLTPLRLHLLPRSLQIWRK